MVGSGNSILKLGVTGGIGSGKSTVCKVFRVLGIPVFSADRVAREIQENDPDIIRKLNAAAGVDLYRDGKLNRAALASMIFNSSNLLEKVNAIIHPAVFRSFDKWLQEQSAPYVIMEAAILFESGAAELMDLIAAIVAPEEERIGRVISRSSLTREQVVERIRNQMDEELRIQRSDYVIYNSENDMVIPSVLKIHQDILARLEKFN